MNYRNSSSMTVNQMNVCYILSNFCPSTLFSVMNSKYSNKYVHHTLQGDNYGSAADIPAGIRSLICTAAMKAMAKVHFRFWVAGGQKKKDGLSKDFWYKQVSC